MRVLFVFIDGVGLGPATGHNPFAQLSLPAFERLAGGHAWTSGASPLDEVDHVFRPIDATLGVDGLPQSGTGQASLFTGINCARLAGRHFGPFPHSKTRYALKAENIFSKVQTCFSGEGEPAAFANAYPPRFFSYAERKDRWTVTTRCCLDAGLPIRSLEALHAGRALTADLTAEGWQALDLDVSPISEATAGARLYALHQAYRFTLFEYFLTDKAGHSRDPDRATRVLQSLDRFFAALVGRFDPTEELLVITSDHGNLEDLSTKSHTRYPVPLIAYGRGARAFRDVEDLTDVVPAVLQVFQC